MPIRWKLKNLNMDEVSFVDRGDNPEARIVLTKARERTETPTMTHNIHAMTPEDRAAVELAKMARARPDLREHIRKASEATHPEPVRDDPLEEMSKASPVLAELEPEILAVMSRERCDFEAAMGKVASDPGYYRLVEAYRQEQREAS